MSREKGTLKQVFKRPTKTERIAVRLTPADKASIEAACRSVGLGLSRYFLELHRYAVSERRRGEQP